MDFKTMISALTNPTLAIALTSAIVAIAAFILSLRTDARAKVAARTKLFLDLRDRFFEVHKGLPNTYADPDWYPSTLEERTAIIRYWHHAFNEWYVTTCLDDKHMRLLWNKFFSDAVLSGLRHNGLRRVAVEITQPEMELKGAYWKRFRYELDRIWRKHHPEDNCICSGIDCTADHNRRGAQKL